MVVRSALAALALFSTYTGAALAADSEHWTVFATQSGKPAMDGDSFGGNPFASALIKTLHDRTNPQPDLATELTEATVFNSDGFQQADPGAMPSGVSIRPVGKAIALVIVFADYGDDRGFVSLPGAAFDAVRVDAALNEAGYRSRSAVVRSKAEYLARVAEFAKDSSKADIAVLYTAGHGMENDGKVWLLPPEFDTAAWNLADAVSVADLSSRMHASARNIVFYAGCRDNPAVAMGKTGRP